MGAFSISSQRIKAAQFLTYLARSASKYSTSNHVELKQKLAELEQLHKRLRNSNIDFKKILRETQQKYSRDLETIAVVAALNSTSKEFLTVKLLFFSISFFISSGTAKVMFVILIILCNMCKMCIYLKFTVLPLYLLKVRLNSVSEQRGTPFGESEEFIV